MAQTKTSKRAADPEPEAPQRPNHIICSDGMTDDDVVAFLEECGDY